MLLDRLRKETASQHRALESAMELPRTIESYRRRLDCFYGYIDPWERQVLKVLPQELDLCGGQKKAEWLRQDLGHLGLSEIEIEALPRCAVLPELNSAAQALGSLYVWEGSTLGGQIISKHLQETLAIQPDDGGRYFFSYGPETGKQWKRFCELLTQFSTTENDSIIVQSATETFATFHQWILSRFNH